jgi:hypothetical protein
MECYSSILSRTLRPPNGSFIESFVALNSMPHHQFCWRGEEREGGSFMGWVRSFIPMKLSRHSYLVLSLGNYAIKLCTETGARNQPKLTPSNQVIIHWSTQLKRTKPGSPWNVSWAMPRIYTQSASTTNWTSSHTSTSYIEFTLYKEVQST